jgi:hypothetical protein
MRHLRKLFMPTIIGFAAANCVAKNASGNHNITFKENKGQVVDQYYKSRNDITFYGTANSFAFYLKKSGVSYQLYKPGSNQPDSTTIYRLDISWLNANTNCRLLTENVQQGVEHFYTSEVPVLDVKSFGTITYKNLYSGIDLKYYSSEGSLKYDYIVKPGADYKIIQFKVEGAQRITKNNDGSITLCTPIGNISEGKPKVYQEGRQIEASWKVNDNVLSFDVGDYDKRKKLVIDPLVLQWLFGYGNSGAMYDSELGYAVITGKNGRAYWCGSENWNLGSSWGSFIKKIGTSQSFLVPFAGYNPTLTIDSQQYIYLAGATTATSNIATIGAHQLQLAGGTDGFIMKLDTNFNKIWGTYFGGIFDDRPLDCAADSNGNIYVCGTTVSGNGISTLGAHQTSLVGSEGFIIKFNTAGYRSWGTYYGGNGQDTATGLAIENGAHLYVSGITNSNSGIATNGSFQPGLSSGTNGFLVKLDTAGNRIWGTYFGSAAKLAHCAFFDKDNIFVVGSTLSANLGTSGVHQSIYAGGRDGIIARFDSGGNRLWCSYIGGTSFDDAVRLSFSSTGMVYVCGTTYSTTSIATPGAYQTMLSGTNQYNTFLLEYDTSGNKKWGTYFLGPSTKGSGAAQCHSDKFNNVYIVGWVASGGAVSANSDAYVAKFSPYKVPTPVITPLSPTTFCAGDSVKLTTTKLSTANYQWYLNGTLVGTDTTGAFSATLAGSYTVRVTHNFSIDSSAPIIVTTFPVPTNSINKTDILCNGDATGSIALQTSGGVTPYTYTWLNLPATTSFVSNLGAGVYSVITTDSNGCSSRNDVTISQPDPLGIVHTVDVGPCHGYPNASIAITVSGGTGPYGYNWSNSANTPTISNLSVGNYTVTVTDANNCTLTDSMSIAKDNLPSPSLPLASICAVTVNPISGKNIVVWEKNGIRHAEKYNIYRESPISGQYSLLASVPANQLSVFSDNTAIPLQQSHRYKLSETDSCNNEFALSVAHKTIHLSANNGVNGEANLLWNQYEGNLYTSHYIMRSVGGGAFTILDQVSSTTTSYTDLNPPTGQKNYRIDINLATSCNPTAKQSSYEMISSNVVIVGKESTVNIIPNPTTNLIKISGTQPEQIVITDLLGKLVMDEPGKSEISIGHFSRGVYIIKLYAKDGSMYHHQKFIKE